MRVLLARERFESGVDFNPLSSELRADPLPQYEKLRSKDPVHRMRLIDGWILTRYEDIDMVLRDHRRFGNLGRDYGYLPYISMLDLDPPEHTKVRGLVVHGFTPRAVNSLEPRITKTVNELLDEIVDKPRFDLIHDIAFPLPIIVIAELLGVPPEDRDQFREWSDVAALVVDPLLDSQQIQDVRQTIEELFDYLETIAEDRRRHPQDDLVTALVNAEEDGERLSREDLLINLVLVLVAGNETTRNLIGNGTLALMKNPDQLRRLRDDPSLLDSAINEMLRYDSPVQLDSRIAREPVEIGGKRIEPDQRVLCALGAANHDPEVFPEPERFDVGRAPRNHLSFGRGIHYCLGAPLAKLEARLVFAGLLSRFESLRLVEEPQYRDQITLRGLEDLWLEAGYAHPVPSPHRGRGLG